LEVWIGDQVPEILQRRMMHDPGVALLRGDLRRGLQAGHHRVERRRQEDHDEHRQGDVAAPQRPLALAVQAVAAGKMAGLRRADGCGAHAAISLVRLVTPRRTKKAAKARIGNMNRLSDAPSGMSPDWMPIWKA